MGNTYLITGGCGFIGSNFILRLLRQREDANVINLDKLTYAGNQDNLRDIADDPRYRFVQGDITDAALVGELMEEADCVVNFAAETHVDRSIDEPGGFVHTNIVGAFQLLEAGRRFFDGLDASVKPAFRMLHVSTDEVYGSLGAGGAFTESTPYEPNSPYSASKASADHIVRAYFATYGLPAIITNCSNNYGPRQFPEKLIPLMIRNALSGKPLPIYGQGLNVRDWLYVDDHVSALWAVHEKGRMGETYNVGGNNESSNIDLVKMLCRLLSEETDLPEKSYRDLITFVEDRPGHDLRYAIDYSKLRGELGWKPRFTKFRDGLKQTIEWYAANEGWWRPQKQATEAKYRRKGQ